jgi:hypothetical protein
VRPAAPCLRLAAAGLRLATAGLLLAAGLPLACRGETLRPILTPVAGGESELTITLDLCECGSCRVAVQNPDTRRIVHSEIDPPGGLAVVASACYPAVTAEVILECGLCPGGSACTVRATLAAGGQFAGETSCQTTDAPGASCAARQTFPLDGAPENPACGF